MNKLLTILLIVSIALGCQQDQILSTHQNSSKKIIFDAVDNPFNSLNVIPNNTIYEKDTNYVNFLHCNIVEATGAKASLSTGPHGIKTYYTSIETIDKNYEFALDGYILCEGLGSYGKSKKLTNVPFIPNAVAEINNEDKAIVIIDTLKNRIYDIWGYNISPNIFINPNKPFCWYANGLSLNSNGLYPSSIVGIGGSNVSLINGAVTPEELKKKEINHPLKFWLPRKCIKYNYHRKPLTSSESDNQPNSQYSIPEGTRLQLEPTLNLDNYNLNQVEKTICKALQKYGMYLVDTNDPTLTGKVKSGISIVAVSGKSYDVNPYANIEDFPNDLVVNSHLYNYSFSNSFIDLLKHLKIVRETDLATLPKIVKSGINGSDMEFCQ